MTRTKNGLLNRRRPPYPRVLPRGKKKAGWKELEKRVIEGFKMRSTQLFSRNLPSSRVLSPNLPRPSPPPLRLGLRKSRVISAITCRSRTDPYHVSHVCVCGQSIHIHVDVVYAHTHGQSGEDVRENESVPFPYIYVCSWVVFFLISYLYSSTEYTVSDPSSEHDTIVEPSFEMATLLTPPL